MFIPSSNWKCGQNKSLFYFFLVWGLKASSLVYFSSVFIASFPPSMLNFLPFPFHRGLTSQLTLNFDRELLVVIIVCPDDPPTTFKRVRNFYFVAILYFVYWPAYHMKNSAQLAILIRAVESDFRKSNKSRMPKSF